MSESEFKNLYEQCFAKIYRYIYARVGSKEEAEDIAAEVFIAVWRVRDQFNAERNPLSLIYTIARNKLCDYLRRYYQLSFLTLDSELLELPPIDDQSKNTDHHNLIIKLEQSLQALGSQYSQLFQLKYKQNMTYPQIAAAMGVSEGNAKVINNRLIKKLKELCNPI